MRIVHNLSALNTLNRLNKNIKAAGSGMERISSGLRINRAADDAAGLAISEKMRAQIRGLEQAERNIQDGISLIQTAEGALASIHDQLQRARELAVQAANDTLTDADRQQIQRETAQLIEDVDRIAKQTRFNTIPLLNRAARVVIQEAGIVWERADTGASGYLSGVAAFNGRYYAVGEFGEIRTSEDGRSWSAVAAGISDNLYGILSNGDQLLAFGDNGALFTSNDGTSWTARTFPTDGIWNPSQLQLSDAIWDGDQYHIVTHRGYLLSSSDGANWTYQILTPNTTYSDIVYNGNTYVAVGESGRVMISHDGISWSAAVSNTTDPLYSVAWTGDRFVAVGDNGTVIASHDGTTWSAQSLNADRLNAIASNGRTVVTGGNHAIPTDNLWVFDDGAWSDVDLIGEHLLDIEFVEDNREYVAVTHNGEFLRSREISENRGLTEKLLLHVGAGEADTFAVELFDASAETLGIEALNLSTREGAEEAIGVVEEAIREVSSSRARLGAYQNALEHLHANVANAGANVAAAESRIRDADLARETMAASKHNILVQAAQAMLAQGNQQPQTVLQLLR